MNAPLRNPGAPSPKPRTLVVGDVVRLHDNASRDDDREAPETSRATSEPAVKKHLRVIIEVIADRAYLAPILTDRTAAAKACPLRPGDMPYGVLDRPSYLAFDLTSTRSLDELQRLVDRGRVPKVASCPQATLSRVRTALLAPDTDLPLWAKRDLQPTAPARRVLAGTSPQGNVAPTGAPSKRIRPKPPLPKKSL